MRALVWLWIAMLSFLPAFAAVQTTAINGKIIAPDGTAVTAGRIEARLNQPGSTPDLSTGASWRVGGPFAGTIAADGTVTGLALVPNDAITPAGTYYVVTISVTAPRVERWEEKWSVTTAPDPVAVGAITRLEVAPGIVVGNYVSFGAQSDYTGGAACAYAAMAIASDTGAVFSCNVSGSWVRQDLPTCGGVPVGACAGQRLCQEGATLYGCVSGVWAQVGGGTVSDATTSSKGIVQLAGDLTGTAASPQLATGSVGASEIATGAVDLSSSDVTGTAPYAVGGTGATSYSAGGIPIAGASAFATDAGLTYATATDRLTVAGAVITPEMRAVSSAGIAIDANGDGTVEMRFAGTDVWRAYDFDGDGTNELSDIRAVACLAQGLASDCTGTAYTRDLDGDGTNDGAGRVLFVPAGLWTGTYSDSIPISASYFSVVGAGQGSTILDVNAATCGTHASGALDDQDGVYEFRGPMIVPAARVSNITISDMTLDGGNRGWQRLHDTARSFWDYDGDGNQKTTGDTGDTDCANGITVDNHDGIVFTSSSNVVLRNLLLRNFQKSALGLTVDKDCAGGGGPYSEATCGSTNVVIDNVTIAGVGEHGLRFHSSNSKISRSNFTYCSHVGGRCILIGSYYGIRDVDISGNTFANWCGGAIGTEDWAPAPASQAWWERIGIRGNGFATTYTPASLVDGKYCVGSAVRMETAASTTQDFRNDTVTNNHIRLSGQAIGQGAAIVFTTTNSDGQYGGFHTIANNSIYIDAAEDWDADGTREGANYRAIQLLGTGNVVTGNSITYKTDDNAVATAIIEVPTKTDQTSITGNQIRIEMGDTNADGTVSSIMRAHDISAATTLTGEIIDVIADGTSDTASGNGPMGTYVGAISAPVQVSRQTLRGSAATLTQINSLWLSGSYTGQASLSDSYQVNGSNLVTGSPSTGLVMVSNNKGVSIGNRNLVATSTRVIQSGNVCIDCYRDGNDNTVTRGFHFDEDTNSDSTINSIDINADGTAENFLDMKIGTATGMSLFSGNRRALTFRTDYQTVGANVFHGTAILGGGEGLVVDGDGDSTIDTDGNDWCLLVGSSARSGVDRNCDGAKDILCSDLSLDPPDTASDTTSTEVNGTITGVTTTMACFASSPATDWADDLLLKGVRASSANTIAARWYCSGAAACNGVAAQTVRVCCVEP